MTLIVETGAGLADSESYISATDATAYHAARGNATWATLTTTQMEEALLRATAFMTGLYRMRWAGARMTAEQALDWPRSLVPRRDLPRLQYYPNDAVPTEVKHACAALAVRAAAGELVSDQGRRTSSVTVGPLSQTFEPGAPVATSYPEVDRLLRPLLSSSGGQVPLVRL